MPEISRVPAYARANARPPQHPKWLLRFARAIHLTAADPDYPGRQIADELEGRLIQLEHCWTMFNNPMPEGDTDKLASQVFA